jgi:hypothetical protein
VQVFRVTVAAASLKWRIDAMAGSGAKPIIAMLDVATPVALNFKKLLRETRVDIELLQAHHGHDLRVPFFSNRSVVIAVIL